MKFSIPVLLYFFLFLAFSGCDFTGTPDKSEKSNFGSTDQKHFAADSPHKQVEKILERARPTPPGVQKDEFTSTSASSATATKPATTQKLTISEDPLLGKKIYGRNCFLCHDQGVAGAPALGSQKDWAGRILKGSKSLVKNALEGFQGNKGVMPARGGNPALLDAEVEAAVLYMLDSLKR